MTGSYNEDVSSSFSKQVRDSISKKMEYLGRYLLILLLNMEKAKLKKWALTGNQEANYLATSPTGTATGFGCNINDYR